MKRVIQMVLTGTMIFVSALGFGQVNTPKIKANNKSARTYLDLMVNIVSTNLNYGASNSDLADYKKSANGIQAGMSFQAGVTPSFSIVSELYFLRKGGNLKANNPLTTNESTLRISTFELPLLARFHAGRFYINAGPSIACNIGGKKKINDLSTKLSFDNSSDGFKRFDAGLQAGCGVEFPFKQRRISIDLRYAYGLTNISRDKEIYNRAVMISVHFSKPWKNNPFSKNKF